MKTYLFFAALSFSGILMGCQKDEELNLIGYPENPITVTTPENAESLSDIKVTATYDGDGNLIPSSPLKRTWQIALSTPSPEDVTLQVAPITDNIPADMVEISATSITIPAGSVAADVTVGIKNDDISFAEDELTAQTYKLGLQVVNGEGVNLKMETAAGKLIIEKEAYQAHVSIVGEEGNAVTMRRVYRDGEFLGEPIRYAFSIQLDRPTKEDLNISFVTEGIAENFMSDVTFTPAEITIPAGEKQSEVIEWSITNDFMATTEEDENFAIALKPVFEITETTLVNEESAVISINLNKTSSLIELVSSVPSEWKTIDFSKWSITLGDNWEGTANDLFDNYRGSYITYKETDETVSSGDITIDLGEELDLVGFHGNYNNEYNWGDYTYVYYVPSKIELFISSDNITWNSIGSIETPSPVNDIYYNVSFSVPVSTRYIRYVGTIDEKVKEIRLAGLALYK